MNRTIAAVLTAAALAWVLAIALAPLMLRGTGGSTAATLVYLAASRICHQKPERSFHLEGNRMPVCARCAGIYAGAAVGVCVAWLGAIRWRRTPARTVLLVAVIPTVLTWTLEHLIGVPFSNVTRAVAAVPLGAAGGWLFVQMLRYDSRLDGEQVLYS